MEDFLDSLFGDQDWKRSRKDQQIEDFLDSLLRDQQIEDFLDILLRVFVVLLCPVLIFLLHSVFVSLLYPVFMALLYPVFVVLLYPALILLVDSAVLALRDKGSCKQVIFTAQKKYRKLQDELEQEKLTSAKLKQEIREQAVQLQKEKLTSAKLRQEIREQAVQLQNNKERDKMNNQRIQELEEELSGLHGPYDYAMSSCPRGSCVIINNINFKDPSGTTSKRDGAEFDHTQLGQLFKELVFTVYGYYDRTWLEMLSIAEEFARNIDHSQFDAFVFIVMSHGGEQDAIYGVNGGIVRVEDLMSWFKAANCPTLQSKPKLFFIQSCRGSSNESLPSSGDVDASDVLSPDSTLARSVCPRESDFLLSFATSPGYVAWRKPQSGSMFIQTLVKAIREYRNSHHLLDILTEVTRRVVESGTSEGQGKIQVPALAHTLRAKVFLK